MLSHSSLGVSSIAIYIFLSHHVVAPLHSFPILFHNTNIVTFLLHCLDWKQDAQIIQISITINYGQTVNDIEIGTSFLHQVTCIYKLLELHQK